MQKSVQNICSNNCEFAKRGFMLSYGSKIGDTYIDADYIWRCTIVDKYITVDSILHQLGCAAYSNQKQNEMNAQAEDLIKEVDQKLDEIEKVMGLTTETPPITEPAPVKEEPIAPPLQKEPTSDAVIDKPEPPVTQVKVESVVLPVVETATEPVTEPKKRKTKKASL